MTTRIPQSQTKTFKIRKSSARSKLLQQQQEKDEVINLPDFTQKTVNAYDLNDGCTYPTITEQPCQEYKVKDYLDDQENINCYRFPHLSFCGCDSNCLLQSFQINQVIPGLSFGNYVSGLKTKHLLQLKTTHILNITCKQFTKRKHYFSYLNLDLHNNTQQDAKKFFRLSNRFINDALLRGGKVFVHCSQMELGAVMVIGYLIGVQKIPFKQGLQLTLKNQMEISPHFLKQLESYDLEKMAFVSIQRE